MNKNPDRCVDRQMNIRIFINLSVLRDDNHWNRFLIKN